MRNRCRVLYCEILTPDNVGILKSLHLWQFWNAQSNRRLDHIWTQDERMMHVLMRWWFAVFFVLVSWIRLFAVHSSLSFLIHSVADVGHDVFEILVSVNFLPGFFDHHLFAQSFRPISFNTFAPYGFVTCIVEIKFSLRNFNKRNDTGYT